MMNRSPRGGERMSNKQQTGVEYLVEQLFPKALSVEQHYHIEKAKEMEKEQTIEFAINYTYGTKRVGVSLKEDFIKLYKQTYEGR
jgi:hypothetical protein